LKGKAMMMLEYLASVFGRDIQVGSVISSVTVTLIVFFYVYTAASFFKIIVYPFEHRVTYYKFFNSYIISSYTDHIIIGVATILWLGFSLKGKIRICTCMPYSVALAIALLVGSDLLLLLVALLSIPIIIFCSIYDGILLRERDRVQSRGKENQLTINYISALAILIGITSIILSARAFVSYTNLDLIRDYSYEIFLVFSTLSPVLLIFSVYGFFVKIVMDGIMAMAIKVKKQCLNPISIQRGENLLTRTKIIFLLLFTMLSVILAILPHQARINIENRQIGVDSDYYVNWLAPLINSKDSQDFFYQAFVVQNHGDRPITLILISVISKIINSNLFYTVEYFPIILGPSLLFVIFYLTRELTGNDTTSLIAAFLTVVSFQTLIGIYAGFYANWFALIVGYLSILFLIRALKRSTRIHFSLFFVSIIVLMLSHTFTWIILLIVMTAFLTAMLKTNYFFKNTVIMLLLIIVFSVVIDVARITLSGSISSTAQDITNISSQVAGPQQFTLRLSNILRTTFSFVGGQFSNFVILALCSYWVIRSSLHEPSNIFLFVFLSIGFVPFLVGNYISQTRVLYNIPFQIPCAIALSSIRIQNGRSLVILSICIWLTAISVRAVSNFA
jgi:hypothetical protein